MLLVFDLETTGLHPDNACVWDFACVAVKDGEIVSHFHSKVQPVLKHFTKAHRDLVQRISGLSESELLELLDAPEWDEVKTAYYAWLMQLERDPDFGVDATSYNREFDFRFLGMFSLQFNHAPCIMNAVTERLGRRVSLEVACQALEVVPMYSETQHRALPDALLAAHLAIKLGMG